MYLLLSSSQYIKSKDKRDGEILPAEAMMWSVATGMAIEILVSTLRNEDLFDQKWTEKMMFILNNNSLRYNQTTGVNKHV